MSPCAGVRTPLLAVAVVLVASTALADRNLSGVKTLQCDFTLLTTVGWKDGVPLQESKPVTFSLRFQGINTTDGFATTVINDVPTEIIARLAGDYLHFIHMFMEEEGKLYVTTVFNKDSRPGRLKAVHTRHQLRDSLLPTYASAPEQYYGDCEAGG